MDRTSNKGQLVSISSTTTDLIDAELEEHQRCASRHCPRCGHKLSKRDWGGLPAGVKFDPTDQELIEHLEAKVGVGGGGEESNKAAHPLIDKFIATLEGEDGICYTHPEKLPGVTRDGLSRHFFHRPSKAYTTGTRKRRKIHTESDTVQGAAGETRWHKTGKTRPVMVHGRQKGCKKILVLYTNFGKNRKPEKTNWVMHQYHLGQHEEEKEGELVVSKIFYQTQPRQCNWTSSSSVAEKSVSVGPAEGSGEASGSVSSMEGGASMAAAAAYAQAFEIHQQLKAADPYGFVSFAKEYDEAGIGAQREGGVLADSMPSMSAAMCDPGDQAPSHHRMIQQDQQYQHLQQQQQQHQQMVNAAYHISRPTNPISQIISQPLMHHTSIILDDHGSFHVPRIILPNDIFQQQQQQQQTEEQHHKIGGRSASGLEEIIMGCTSSSSADLKEEQETSMRNPEEAEWFKYSSSSAFWHDPVPDNQDHHGYKS